MADVHRRARNRRNDFHHKVARRLVETYDVIGVEDLAVRNGRLVQVNPRHTSQTCSQCDHVDAGNRVTQAEFRCQRCGFTAHADENAACNIATRAGLGSGRANAA